MLAPQTEVLITIAGRESGRFVFEPGDYVIGCDSDCHIRVDAKLVSRQHAKLILNYDHALIEDLGSAHGTQVNGQPVAKDERTRLWPNQKIQVGTATIELRRLKVEVSDMSLAPSQALVKRVLPEEFLREKKYDIGKVVAQGGMGAILDAKEATTERTVAMKVMLDSNDADGLARFLNEAKVTAQLEHPNIVPVHELSVDENGQPYYTMKFVKGITLKKVLEVMAAECGSGVPPEHPEPTGGTPVPLSKKYPLPALLTIFQKVCDALAFAHSKGVIHRDLKPENIMIGDFGEVLVMDWGLAKIFGPPAAGSARAVGGDLSRSAVKLTLPGGAMPTSAESTMDGTIMGTPQFMSPEQARGEVETIDARSDIYSLGAILYQMLSLRVPVTGTDAMEVVGKVGRGEIEPLDLPPRRQDAKGSGREKADLKIPASASLATWRLGGHLPGGRIPDSLAAVVRKAMALDRERRYATVADLQRDIAAYQTGFATSAENATLVKQLVLLVKRHKGMFGTAAAAWLIITALAVWFVLNLRQKEQRAVTGEQRAVAGEQAAKAAEAVAVEEREAARQSLARAALNLAEAAQREGNGPEMQAALNEVPDDLRDSTWNYLLAESDTSFARIRQSGPSEGLAAHPKRPGVFAVAASRKVALIEVRTGVRLLEFTAAFPPDTTGGGYRVAFSPDGERIAVGRDKDGGIVIHSARDGKKLAGWEIPAVGKLAYSPDGTLLLRVKTGGAELSMLDAGSGQMRWSYEPKASAGKGMFTPDGQHVLTHGFHDFLRVVRAQDGKLVRQLGKDRLSTFAIRSDGRLVVTAMEDGRVQGLNFEDGSVLFEVRAENRWIQNIVFTPDGGRFVTVAELADGRQSLRVWDAATGAPLQTLLGGNGPVANVSVHPLSGELFVSGPNARVWNLTGTPEKWVMRGTHATNVAFWGSDDVLFAPGTHVPLALMKLQGNAPVTLWKTGFNANQYIANVSADGRMAVLNEANGGLGGTLLRNPGPTVEPLATFKTKYSLSRVRLSPTGDLLAMTSGKSGRVELFDTAHPSELLPLDRQGMKKFNDIGWLGGGLLIRY